MKVMSAMKKLKNEKVHAKYILVLTHKGCDESNPACFLSFLVTLIPDC